MARKQFFRSLPRKGFPLYWILLAYLVVGYFYPVIKDDVQIPYFVQDTPYVQKSIIPDIRTMEMPFSMLTLDYNRIFTYPEALKELLGDCPVAYADRFKRPVVRSNGHTYPISLEKQAYRWCAPSRDSRTHR